MKMLLRTAALMACVLTVDAYGSTSGIVTTRSDNILFLVVDGRPVYCALIKDSWKPGTLLPDGVSFLPDAAKLKDWQEKLEGGSSNKALRRRIAALRVQIRIDRRFCEMQGARLGLAPSPS